MLGAIYNYSSAITICMRVFYVKSMFIREEKTEYFYYIIFYKIFYIYIFNAYLIYIIYCTTGVPPFTWQIIQRVKYNEDWERIISKEMFPKELILLRSR